MISVVDSRWLRYDRPWNLVYDASKMAEAVLKSEVPTIQCFMFAVRLKSGQTKCGRIHFNVGRERRLPAKVPDSHVLQHYRYGCLGEGNAKWNQWILGGASE